MNKKGFTLIELLAAIVILAIIALIAVPIVLDVISDTRKNSAEISIKNIDKAASLYFQKNYNNENIIFECNKDKCKSGKNELELAGKSPESGRILIDKKGNITYEDIVLNGFNCYKEHDKFICDSKKTRKEYKESEIVINSSSEYNLLDYNIYGNSIQTETILQYESVGDKSKNLVDRRGLVIGNLNEDGTVNMSKKYRITSDYIEVKPNTYYVASGKRIDGTSLIALYCQYDENFGYISRNVNTRILTTENTKYVKVCFYTTDITDTTIEENIETQIEEGTVATDYEPYYDNYKISVKVIGKNLFDLNNVELKDPVYYKKPERLPGGFKLYHKYAYGSASYKYVAEKDQTLTFSYNATIGNGEGYTPYVWAKLNDKDVWGIINGKVFELRTGDKLILYFAWNCPSVYTITGEESATFTNIQLEEGKIATEYKPYTETITNIYIDEPLRQVGDKADYIDFKNQKVVRYIEEDSEGNLKVLSIPKEEKIELPDILLRKGVNNIEIDTSVKPSKVELEYYKKEN